MANPSLDVRLLAGSAVWVRDDDSDQAWFKAEVVSVDVRAKTVRVSTDRGGDLTVAEDAVLPRNSELWSATEGLTAVSDLATLTHLHEAEVLHALQLRYDIDQIYTFCGPILIAVNPFKAVRALYDVDALLRVQSKQPHVYTVARTAFAELCSEGLPQVVLVSGESGAGKTETTKHVLKYLLDCVNVSPSPSSKRSGSSAAARRAAAVAAGECCQKRVLSSNPLLEAFGNACTTRNNNSSRFGKFIELRFANTSGGSSSSCTAYAAVGSGDASGSGATVLRPEELSFECAAVDCYLLEKARITELHRQERSYHIFYQACAALQRFGPEFRGLPLAAFAEPRAFAYLRRCGRIEADGDDARDFEKTKQSMDELGIPQEEQAAVLRVVAAVLHVGNIGFEDRPAAGGCEVAGDGATAALTKAAVLLGLTPGSLAKALTHRLIAVRHTQNASPPLFLRAPSITGPPVQGSSESVEVYEAPLPPKQAEERRESLARVLYAQLFARLVQRLNVCLGSGPGEGSPISVEDRPPSVGSSRGRPFVGILDIFGFEHFDWNSFEQLCINFANERLQQLFNHFVFASELDLYNREGIQLSDVDVPDNQDVIDLIQGARSSIFALLDEECRMPRGSDQAFVNKLWKTFECHPRFKVEVRKPTSFAIHHFAGPVSYDGAHFLEKNVDELGELLKQALASSCDGFVKGLADLLEQQPTGVTPGPARRTVTKPKTVSQEFKNQLEVLITKMGAAGPHFVRCLKPNAESKPDRFDRAAVASQLRSGGVVEVLRVQRAGYPCRSPRAASWCDLGILFTSAARAEYEEMEIEARLHKALEELRLVLGLEPGFYALGKTTVFYKQAAFEALEGARLMCQTEAARQLQSAWRCRRISKFYQMLRDSCVCLQAAVRGHLARRQLQRKQWPLTTVALTPPSSPPCPPGPHSRKTSPWGGSPHTADEVGAVEALWPPSLPKTGPGARGFGIGVLEEFDEIDDDETPDAVELLCLERASEARRTQDAVTAAVEEERRYLSEEAASSVALELEAHQRAVSDLEHKHQVELLRLRTEHSMALEAEKELREAAVREAAQLRHEAELRQAELEQRLFLARLREQEAVARTAELERQLTILAARGTAEAVAVTAWEDEQREFQCSELQAAARQQEALRVEHRHQLEQLRRDLEQAHGRQQETTRRREVEVAQSFQEELRACQEREGALRRRHEEAFQEMIGQEAGDTGAAGASPLFDPAAVGVGLHDSGHMQELPAPGGAEQLVASGEGCESCLVGELEACRVKHDEEVAALKAQFELQRRELSSSCKQEVALARQNCEQREQSLSQLLEQARLGQSEKQRTLEVQLVLKRQQQDELYRSSVEKTQQMEDSARRQQELYETQVRQLLQQLREIQETFRRQLEESQAQSDRRLQEMLGQVMDVDQRLHSERQRLSAAKEECAARLGERIVLLEEECTHLRHQLARATQASSPPVGRRRRREACDDGRLGSPSSPLCRMAASPGTAQMESPPMACSRSQRGGCPGADSSEAVDASSASPVKPHSRSRTGAMRSNGAPPWSPGESSPARRRRSCASYSSTSPLKGLLPEAAELSTNLPSSATNMPPWKVPSTPPPRPPPSQLLRASDGGQGNDSGTVAVWQEISPGPRGGGRVAGSAITILCFAEAAPDGHSERLAVARQSGLITVLSVPRKVKAAPDGPNRDEGLAATVVAHCHGHSRAVTFMSFTAGGAELLTTSTDWTIRFWRASDGHLVQRIQDSAVAVCAIPLPVSSSSPRGGIVVANSNAVLKLVQGKEVQQKVRLDYYARSMMLVNCSGATGQQQGSTHLNGRGSPAASGGNFGTTWRLLAGTSRGCVHTFSLAASGLRLSGKLQVSNAALTCLALAPCGKAGTPPMVLASSMDATLCVLQANAALSNLTVLRRLPVAQRLLPLRCCHVAASSVGAASPRESEGTGVCKGAAPPGIAGFAVSGSEDGAVRIFDLESFVESRLQAHAVPVVDVATSGDATLLASGDVHGRVLLWRRSDATEDTA